MTPVQAKAARRLFGWFRKRLGAVGGAPAATVGAYERYGRLIRTLSGSIGGGSLLLS